MCVELLYKDNILLDIDTNEKEIRRMPFIPGHLPVSRIML